MGEVEGSAARTEAAGGGMMEGRFGVFGSDGEEEVRGS